MNSLLYYYNNVQKMAAFRQAKRLQRGVKLGYKQFGNGVNDTRFESAPIPIGTSDFSLELYMNSYGSNQSYQFAFNKRVYSVYAKGSIFLHNSNSYENGIYSILMEAPADGASNADSIYPSWQAPTADEKYLLTITRQGTTVKVYINGELKATKEQSEVKDLGDLQLAIANSSDVGFVRVWNMCLSADDVTAHYNNGDPMGYVVPKAMRELLSVNLIGSNSFTWDGSDSPYYYNITGNPITIGKYYKINVTVSDYQSGSPRIFAGISYPIPAQNGTFDIVVYNERYVNNFPIYGGSDGDPNRHLTITVNSITSVGLLAEYLPQNLMEYPNAGDLDVLSTNSYTWTGPDDSNYGISIPLSGYITAKKCVVTIEVSNYEAGAPFFKISTSNSTSIPQQNGTFELEQIILGDAYNRVAIYGGDVGTDRRMTITVKGIRQINGISYSWLDSAKQLPLSDEYMEPLFQSISGYDMMANGAPEILYNE